MRFDVISLFPDSYRPIGVVDRAVKNDLLEVFYHNLRSFGLGNYNQVDDEIYGGGAGMLLRVDVLVAALNSVPRLENSLVIALSARGKVFSHEVALDFQKYNQIIIVCGRYEGIDQRFIEREFVKTNCRKDLMLPQRTIP